MPAIQLQHLKGFLVSCTSFLAVPLERLPWKSQQCQRAPPPEVQPHLVTTVWSPSAPQGPLNDTCCWCHAEMVGSTGQAFKSRVGAECRQVAKQSEGGLHPTASNKWKYFVHQTTPLLLEFLHTAESTAPTPANSQDEAWRSKLILDRNCSLKAHAVLFHAGPACPVLVGQGNVSNTQEIHIVKSVWSW